MAEYNSLIFDGIDSSEFGVYLSGEGTFNAPARKGEKISVPGRNGDLFIETDTYENVSLKYPAFIHQSFDENIRELRNQLSSRSGYKRLTDSFHPEEFRLARYGSGLDVNVKKLIYGDFDIIFDCKPQRFLVSGEEEIEITEDRIIENPTLYASEPLLKVTGNGSITIGDYKVTISGNSGTIWVDSELNDYYVPAGTLEPLTDENLDVITDDLGIPIEVISGSGSLTPIRPEGVTVTFGRHEYPKLMPGQNVVYVSEIDSLVVIPRWWII